MLLFEYTNYLLAYLHPNALFIGWSSSDGVLKNVNRRKM